MKKYILALSLGIAFQSCSRDTCNSKLGDTFNEVTIERSYIDTTDNSIHIILSINTQDDLTPDYFKDSYLVNGIRYASDASKENSNVLLDSISVTQYNIFIKIDPQHTSMFQSQKEFNLYLRFSDRQNYIDCKHGGSADMYYLDLLMKLQIENNTPVISNFNWEEKFSAGGY